MPRRQDDPSPQELRREASHVEERGESDHGKNPRNVAGGKKAAATRKEEHHTRRGRGSHER